MSPSSISLAFAFLAAAGCAAAPPPPPAGAPSAAAVSAQPPAAPAPAPAPPPAVARIDGQPVTARDLDAHQSDSGLGRADALQDLVDLILLRAAATPAGITVPPGRLAPEARAAAEYALAQKLGVDLPPAADILIVDHAWTKDAAEPKQRKAQRAAMDRLRAAAAAGEPIPAAHAKLGAAVANWHVGDHEEYPYTVIPPEARDLPPGGLSPVIPGDGGIHLFRIFERKRTPPAADVVRPPLRERLRQDKTIEIVEQPQP